MRLNLLLAGAAIAVIATTPARSAPDPAQESQLRGHVTFLADDALRGREAGTPDYDVAAAYVAAQMLAIGLEPAGADGNWYQPVPLVTASAAAEPEMTLTRGGTATPLAFGTDFTLRAVAGPERVQVSAPVVFAGYGISDPAIGRDDYAGLDVRGKIVAILYSGPKGLNSEISAHLGSRADRAVTAGRKGAAGILYLMTSQIEGAYPFDQMKRAWQSRAMAWANADGTPRDLGAPALGVVSFAGADKLFGAKRWAAIRAADDAGKPLPHRGPLDAAIATDQRFTVERTTSPNVVGRIPGSDPSLAAEAVVLTAHLDHVGTRATGEGDRISNGAMDNAIGIAAMLEVARTLRASPTPPRRSILVVAVTAEEKGLIGSDYFARFPTIARDRIVANVNLDMPILTYRFQDLVAYGADRSSIGAAVDRAARAGGFALVPDPDPGQASFVRTDHYSFVRQGVPSVSLEPGPGGAGQAATKLFLDEHYHQVSDDMKQPFDWTAASAFVRVNADIALDLANGDARPTWKKGDYFGLLYGGPGAK
ncbi:M28 family metallopeptidase [Sphingomonas sp. BGYR3]|uniref:M28 family metallopeptidase n=1 Tax=Sphingomonas sp. BGYR3 TaxID=2975483 RepID=UPI0021A90C25|nr:M28 family metallopeptidase [Sphingomonas sp. BGYR3]MDG5489018.1 M28 family metallopeptidase [Sphingomonas sp. BGYR3]